MKLWAKLIMVILIVLVIIGTSVGILYFLAVTDDDAGKYHVPASTEIVEPCVEAALTGKETPVTEEQINGFFTYFIENHGLTVAGSPVNTLYLRLGGEAGDAGLYLNVTKWGRNLGLTARCQIAYLPGTKEFSVQVKELKVGRLGLPVSWVLGWLSPKLPDAASVDGDTVLIDASALQVPLGDLDSSLTVTGFRIEGGGAYIQTNGVMDALQSYVKKKLEQGAGSLDDFLSQFGISLQ